MEGRAAKTVGLTDEAYDSHAFGSRELRVVDRGVEDFISTTGFQRRLVAAKIEDSTIAQTIIFVEHPHVYSVGRSVAVQKPSWEEAKKVPWIEVNRGGQATYHGPGQLVVYPIFDLSLLEKDVHVYLRSLEKVIISCLSKYGLLGRQCVGRTGVWVEHGTGEDHVLSKIASIGIGLRRWVTYHGFSINVRPDLRYFHDIEACDSKAKEVSSLEEVMRSKGSRVPSIDELKNDLLASFEEVFGFTSVRSRPSRGDTKPSWLRARIPSWLGDFDFTKSVLKRDGLVTVCEEARCPNIGECWTNKTASFMIMGESCTRRCGFCAVKDGVGSSLLPLDPFEPWKIAQAVNTLGLSHVVVTSVNRDDLEDMGARAFDRTVRAIKRSSPECSIELLIPDMQGRKDLLGIILSSGNIHILNHNVETVPRLYREVRPGARLERSLQILRWAKEISPQVRIKSGIMVGLGEEEDEVVELLGSLRAAGCEIVTIGQYLQPTPKQLPVQEYVRPEVFQRYYEVAIDLGFEAAESAPLVRSSYHAWKHRKT